jgi:hypothetical protein
MTGGIRFDISRILSDQAKRDFGNSLFEPEPKRRSYHKNTKDHGNAKKSSYTDFVLSHFGASVVVLIVFCRNKPEFGAITTWKN